MLFFFVFAFHVRMSEFNLVSVLRFLVCSELLRLWVHELGVCRGFLSLAMRVSRKNASFPIVWLVPLIVLP